MRRKVFILLMFGLILTFMFFSLAGGAEGKVRIRALFMKQAGYSEEDVRNITDEFLAKNPNIDVDLTFVAYEALHDKTVTAAVAGTATYDLVLIDCIWPAEYASAGFVKDVTDRITPQMIEDIWPAVLEAVTWKGRIYGMPWLNDILYFFYNEKMLKDAGFSGPPATWSELIKQSKRLKAAGIVEYPMIDTWQQFEGVTISYLNYLFAFGGKAFDEQLNPLFNKDKGVEALQFMVDNLNAGIFNPASFEAYYDEIRLIFSQGKAAYGMNWAYMWQFVNDPKESQIAGQARLALMPGEGVKSSTINGGMGLSIMKNSPNPDEAWNYILYLSSKDVQKRYSKNALPIWKSLFNDPLVIKEQPRLVEISREQYKYIFNRPLVPWYSEFSVIMQKELSYALTGSKSPQQALNDAAKQIEEVKKAYKS